MSKRKIKKLDRKYYLYCFSPGDTEIDYFKKYINETLSDKINFNKGIKIHQLSFNIDEEQKNIEINKIIDFIVNRNNTLNEYGLGKIIVLITDCDKAKLEHIEDLRKKFIEAVSKEKNINYYIFILNYQLLEDWLIYYYDKKEEKSKIRRDVTDHWDKVFKGRHYEAVNKYLKEHSQNKVLKMDNYTSIIESKKYSDFPYAFECLKSI